MLSDHERSDSDDSNQDTHPTMTTADDLRVRILALGEDYTERVAIVTQQASKRMDFSSQYKTMEQLKALQADFISAMGRLEDMLYEMEHAPLKQPVPEPARYQPAVPRKRGRPSTGGRKPRDRRVHKDDDSY